WSEARRAPSGAPPPRAPRRSAPPPSPGNPRLHASFSGRRPDGPAVLGPKSRSGPGRGPIRPAGTRHSVGNMPNAIVTGASKGLGFALAQRLAEAGWNLIIDARHAADLDRAADRLRATGPAPGRAAGPGDGGRVAVEAIPGDVTDPAHRAALIGAAEARGGLDLL